MKSEGYTLFMKDISDLLSKFKNLGFVEHKVKDSLIEILKKDLNLNVSRKDIEIKERILRVKISGPQKTEILLNKKNILNKLNSNLDKEIRDLV